jgi:hypothetical protein
MAIDIRLSLRWIGCAACNSGRAQAIVVARTLEPSAQSTTTRRPLG